MRRAALRVFPAALLLCGCADREFRRALRLQARRPEAAAVAFKRFADGRTGDPRAPEALARAGDLYARELGRCAEARPLYERAVREVPTLGPWGARARLGLMDCPEYFPLRDGMRWVYVDSMTGGKNMRLEVSAFGSPDAACAELSGQYYAGATRFSEFRRSFCKEDWSVWEALSGARVRILRYPYRPGMSWTGAAAGEPTEFRIESAGETVRVRAGVFKDCLKVRVRSPGAEAWAYEYYAPGVGRVKTTVGGRAFETPNTELKSYHVPRKG